MSLYCGLSLQEVYARKCDDVGCKRNSLVYSMLSKTPDDFGLTFVDVSRNFVGPKGILALLEVIQCCRSLRNLDFRDQQLTKETVDAICVSLRAHPSVIRVNLSDNPINIAGGAAILELVRHNPNIEYVLLDNTHVRDTMIHTIEKQLAHNREAKRAVKGPNAWGNATDVAQDCQLESPRSQAVCGSGAAAVGLLRTSDAAATGIVAKAAPKEQRIPSLEVHALLSNFSSTVHDYLFDESPMDFMARQCADRFASFHDVQFPSDDKTVQREATQEFGIAGWKRLSELFPGATLFPRRDEDWGKCTGQNPFVLPERPRGGMTWLYAAVSASMSSRASLQSLILEPDEEIGNVGLFGVRFYIDGAWRFVLVDDFVPVNFCGEMIFTKPTQDGQYFWPCILEKVLAKLYGGYHELDQDVRRRRLIYEREEGLNADATMKKGPCCATVMGDFTGGVSIRRDLHHEAFDSNNWWMSMMGLMGEDPSSSMCVAMSRNEDKVLPGIDPYRPYQVLQARQVNGVRLLQIRFPWATNRWRGDWSEDSPSWSEYPDVDHAIRLKSSAQSRLAPNMKSKVISVATMNPKAKPLRMANFLCAKGMYGNASTGTTTEAFWISYLDFLKTFEEVHLCIHFAGYKERVIEGNWGVHTSGGPSSCHTWYTNPHFRLQVLQDGPFFINVSVPDTRFSTNPVDCIGFHILDDPLYPIRSPETTTGDGTPSERVVMDCKYVRSDSVSFEGIMKAGKVMWIIPSTYAAGMMGRFLLRIFSPASFVLSHEALERYWHKVDLMDTVMASGELQAGEDNSQVSITIAERDGLNGSSHAEETGDVGRIVVRAALENYELPESLQPFSTSLSDREGSAKRTCISSPLVASDDGNRPSMALYLVEAEMPRRDNIPSRTVGRLAGSDVLAESPFVVSERVFAETEIFSGDLMNVVCCIQPVGCTAAIKYTVWSTLPIQRCLACPQWQKECVDVRWDVGSGSYYEADHQPQVELTPVKANQRFVARLDLTEFTCIEPTIVLTVLANKDRVGEGLMGSILPERIVARSEYTRGTWVQCEFELTQDLDSVLVIPCLQPAGSMGAGRLCVSSEAEFFRVRTLTSVPTMEHAS